ncbi:MAG TPA: acyl carrier protein, partial [Alphaproteobacteria bacterium]|nr:acyl carrier protein [Alphaproteobacteria bacterium]
MNDESNDIKDQVFQTVAEHLGVEKSKIAESSSFIDDLGAD